MPRVLRIGHRGAAGHAPENTLAAVRQGIELGVDFVEIDVRRTADGVLVALHDATVNRTTNGRGRVDALSLGEVPQMARGRTGLMLELKVDGLAHLTVHAVQKVQLDTPVIYASF